MTRQIVPAYVEIGKGNWVRVGQAAVDIQMGSADITLDDDAPVADALKAMMSSRVQPAISIGFGTEEYDIDRNEHHFLREVLPMDEVVPAPKPLIDGVEELAEAVHSVRDKTEIHFDQPLYTPRPGRPYGLSDEQLVHQMRMASHLHSLGR